MFNWLNKQGVESDKGFIVQFVSRYMIEYRENNKIISVDVEEDIAPNNEFMVIIKRSSFQKWSNGNYISTEKQKEIIQNFTDGMNFQNTEVGRRLI